MTKNEQETMELFKGPVTRARARKMKEHDDGVNNELLALVKEAIEEGLKFKMESLEDGCKPPKLPMIQVLNKGQQMEQVGGTKLTSEG